MTKIAGSLLILLYASALFAGFFSPYSPDQEFRDHFFHPPSTIHFRDSNGHFIRPYVGMTYLLDSGKHVFAEGIPVSVVFSFPELNQNPYIAEPVEQETPIATLKTENGQVLGSITTLNETGENTGLFRGIAVIKITGLRKLIIVARAKTHIFLVGSASNTPYSEAQELFLEGQDNLRKSPKQFPLSFFLHGAPYRLFGILPCDLHLLGVSEPAHLFLLGTDQSGRDIFSRILYGARISLTVGLIGVFLTTLFGWWIGSMSGYFGGITDTIFMRIADIVMAVPALYLILAVRNVFPIHLSSELSYVLMIVVLSFTGWALMSRVIRGMVLSLREEQFVIAAKSNGATSTRILVRHIWPCTAAYVIVRATLLIPSYILAEATLSFLGVGIQEPVPSWGNMLSAAQDLRVLSQFSWSLAPGLFLFITVLAFNFFGEGMRKRFSIREI